MIEDILALIVNKIITDDLKQNPTVNVGSWAYLMNIKADFLIGFDQTVNLPYCFQKQSRKTRPFLKTIIIYIYIYIYICAFLGFPPLFYFSSTDGTHRRINNTNCKLGSGLKLRALFQ